MNIETPTTMSRPRIRATRNRTSDSADGGVSSR